MLQTMPCTLTVLALFATAGPADEAKPKDRGTTDPKGVPLELKVVVQKDSYVLDLGGKTPGEFAQPLKTGPYPPAPEVDLVLELRNAGARELKVWVGGGSNMPVLELKGPGAVGLAYQHFVRRRDIPPEVVTLAPGKSRQVPVRRLSSVGLYSGSNRHRLAYWTEPGEYTLTASYHTAVSPAPQGAKAAGNGFGYVTVTGAPIKLKVIEKK
jgi:hypothetical protein